VIAVLRLLEAIAALFMRRMTRSAGIGSANRSALELVVFMKVASVDWDARRVFRDSLGGVSAMVSSGGCILKLMTSTECGSVKGGGG
jgi:hypothetical protein